MLSGGRAKTTQDVRFSQSSSADLRPAEQFWPQRAVLTESYLRVNTSECSRATTGKPSNQSSKFGCIAGVGSDWWGA